MSLATIDLKSGFVDRQLIAELPDSGALTRIANPTPIDLIGREIQTIDFSGEMGIFGEGAANATAEEKTKSGNDATNGKLTINPITYYISYRFPKKFLALFGVSGAYNPSDPMFRAGSPSTMLDSIMAQPYQAGVLEQYRAYVNRSISRALDFSAGFGLNPKTKAVSAVARTNGYLLDNPQAVKYTPDAQSAASIAFRTAVRNSSTQGDNAASGVVTSKFLNAIADERTTIGSAGDYANQIPLLGGNVNIQGIPLSASNTISDTTAVTNAASTVVGTGTLAGVIGNFRDRFVWGAIPLSGIEVFDSGNPDNSDEGDLGAVNKVMLRTEVALGWGFLGGSEKFSAIYTPAVAEG